MDLEEHANNSDEEWEPMDVDLSINSSTRSNLSPRKPAPPPAVLLTPTIIVKKFQVDLSHSRRQHNEVRSYLWMLSVLIILGLVGFHYFLASSCCTRDSLPSVQNSLSDALYGQDSGVALIATSLADKNYAVISFLYGPTGVGKTYAAQIILEHARNYSNVFHFMAITKERFLVNSVVNQQTLCDYAFVVVDDINIGDDYIVKTVNEIVTRSNILKKGIHFILIYNSAIVDDYFGRNNDVNFKGKIEELFINVRAVKYFVEFEALSEMHLKRCIENALMFYHYPNKITDELISDLMKNFNVELDGCKSVDSKIKSMKLDM